MSDVEEGVRLGREGAERAADHADREHKDWKRKAHKLFGEFGRQQTRPFITESARIYAEDHGLPPPPDKRAWGAVAQAAVRAKVIRPIGYAPARNPKVHGSTMRLWKWIGGTKSVQPEKYPPLTQTQRRRVDNWHPLEPIPRCDPCPREGGSRCVVCL